MRCDQNRVDKLITAKRDTRILDTMPPASDIHIKYKRKILEI